MFTKTSVNSMPCRLGGRKAVEYTDCTSAEEYDSQHESPNMTLTNLMVRVQ